LVRERRGSWLTRSREGGRAWEGSGGAAEEGEEARGGGEWSGLRAGLGEGLKD